MELSVEEDFVVGTVRLDPLESFDELLDDWSGLTLLALDRRRRSLKNGIWSSMACQRCKAGKENVEPRYWKGVGGLVV